MIRRLAAGALCALSPLIAYPAMAGVGSPDQRNPHRPALARANDALRAQIRTERRRHERDLHRAAQARPSVQEALTLAAVLYGVDRSRMAAITWRESRWRPWAKNAHSSAGGIAQFLDTTWATTPCGKAGLSRFSPYPAAMCMAWLVKESGWSHWALTTN
jgi:soluble lytic murein transglycosylase-like protein